MADSYDILGKRLCKTGGETVIVVPASWIFMGYVALFGALTLALWLYPKFQSRVLRLDLRAFYCARCGHVCVDRGDGAPVRCLQCGHLNQLKP